MSKARLELNAVENPQHGPELHFEINDLTKEQLEIVYQYFIKLHPQRFISCGKDFLKPESQRFTSEFKTGDEAKMFFAALQELGIEFETPMQIKENIALESNRLKKMKGLQKG